MTEISICQGRIIQLIIRGATLIHRNDPMRLAGYRHILGIYTLAYSVAEYFGKTHLTAPSAVHLTTCFLPDSQHRRLSVKASLPLSPLQRFKYSIIHIIRRTICCVNIKNENFQLFGCRAQYIAYI